MKKLIATIINIFKLNRISGLIDGVFTLGSNENGLYFFVPTKGFNKKLQKIRGLMRNGVKFLAETTSSRHLFERACERVMPTQVEARNFFSVAFAH